MTTCDCQDVCKRYYVNPDGGGWFCPYVPGDPSVCKKTIGVPMRPMASRPSVPRLTDKIIDFMDKKIEND